MLLCPPHSPSRGSGVAAVAGPGVWHHQGLALSELNYFFKSKHCKAVEPRVFHSWPCAGSRAGVPVSKGQSSVLWCLARPRAARVWLWAHSGPRPVPAEVPSAWCHAVPAGLAQLCELFPPQALSLLSSVQQLTETLTSCLVTRPHLPPGTSSCCVLRTTALSPS